MTRTLVVHTGGIGDFLLACGAIESLAKDGPVELAGQPSRLELAVAGGVAVAAHDLHRIDFDSVFTTPSTRLAEFLRGFDRAIVWMRDDGTIARALKACGLTEVLVCPGLPPDDWSSHASDYYYACLGTAPGPPFRLRVEQPRAARAGIIIHPGSGGRRKNWPVERFEALTEQLLADGHAVTWLLGPAEESVRVPSQVSTVQEASLVVLAKRLAATGIFVGNDSGMSHLAAAVGTQAVVIFGPTNPVVWAPQGPQVAVLRDANADDGAWPPVAEVSRAVYDGIQPRE